MTAKELAALVALTKKFREDYAWDRRERPKGRLEHAPSELLRAVRYVEREGGFYRRSA